MTDFERELATAINKGCHENESNTPDFILAEYMKASLDAFNAGIKARDRWYGMQPHPGMTTHTVAIPSTPGGISQRS